MAYALKLCCIVVFVWLLITLNVGCVSVEKPKQLSLVSVKTIQPSHWYNNQHRDYYDIYGPVKRVLISPIDTDVVHLDESRELNFNPDGYLTQQKSFQSSSEIVINYHYFADYRPDRVLSYIDDKPYRSTTYQYDNKQMLINIRFEDKQTNKRFNIKQKRQAVTRGWFEMAVAVEAIEPVEYRQYSEEGVLLWTSKGGINNGAGKRFYIKTSDHITSANVVNRGTQYMQGVGGYAFGYNKKGRLWQVSSFNAHNHEIFHTTQYAYNEQGLLQQEIRIVTGQSIFNEAQNESVNYEYQQTDQHGNWIRRIVKVTNPKRSFSFHEERKIFYYE